MNDTDRQQRLVLWAYIIQGAALLLPPVLVASLMYLLIIRNRVTINGLRSHVNWQLMTLGVTAALVLAGIVLLIIAGSGVNTDAPISIIATFVLVGASALFPLWFIYRVVWGAMRFSKQIPIMKLLP